ncbi:transposase [Brevibacillus choshinensis]|nr:transposase [Brevibacillus choshinensis]
MGDLRRTHSIEFKQKAVDMYLKEGKGYQTVAKELGVRHSSVQLWVKRFR